MRNPRLFAALSALAALPALVGCMPPEDMQEGALGLVAGVTETVDDETTTTSGPLVLRGTVHGDEYELIELGPAAAGEEWIVEDDNGPLTVRPFVVVLFDERYELLRRQVVSPSNRLAHIMRGDTKSLYLGVTSSYTGTGDFRLTVRNRAGNPVPAPVGQVVYLNFAGGYDISVHTRRGMVLEAFEGAMLGDAYADATRALKDAIVAALWTDYAGYNVTIRSSDDGPPPDGPHATLHFGGLDRQLLGLADGVDQYNADPNQHAIIYVQSFAEFEVMGLSADEMGQMVGNVASHELGHLLGLFHTRVPDDLMDTTGTAWDLAGDQFFQVAELEPSVFPFGSENSPARLAETLGTRSEPGAGLEKSGTLRTIERKAAVRAAARLALRGRCGTCRHLDE